MLLDSATAQGQAMRSDWIIFLITAAVIGGIVAALILIPTIVWREREGRAAAQFSGNPVLEIAYTVVPLVVVIVLFGVTYARERIVDALQPQASRIGVTAFRWSWRFDYGDERLTVFGTPLTPPTLYLPLNRTSEIDLRSDDVTHSFWVPAFLFKRDAIPGLVNRFDLTPTRLGTFPGKCAQFCGMDHAAMTFVVRVVPAAAYDRYVASAGTAVP